MGPTMEKFVSTLQEWLTADDIIQNIEGCLGCGNCSQACAWYLGTGDERLRPNFRSDFIRKIYRRYLSPEGKVLGKLGIYSTPTTLDLKREMDVFWKCTACGRCSLACPRGINNRRLTRIGRAAYTDSGFSKDNLTVRNIIENTASSNHSFGHSVMEVFAKVGLMLRYEDVEIPIDVYGAEYLFVCPAAGNTKIPELGIKIPKILNAAGISYTMTSGIVDTGTDVDHIAVNMELTRRLLVKMEEEAQRLGVQKIFVAECGCDVRTFYVEATEILGRPFRFPIVHIDTVIYEAIMNGQLPVEPIDQSVTFHDPCYVTRLSGLGEQYRDFMNLLVKDFREMTPNREYNYCCNAGSGGLAVAENADIYRKISVIKAEQIKNTGAELVTSPCAICYVSLKNITEYYGIATDGERKAMMFFEIIYEAVKKALLDKGEYHRVKTPLLHKDRDELFLERHSLNGFLRKLQESPEYSELLQRLAVNPNVINYAGENPGFDEYLQLQIGESGVSQATGQAAS
ncbi:MAG: (Fe-S)-binding protein [Peptococcaceae bacterium]|nr:(Fe-S)-binding protein [Peptococcaceae bacterium]